MSRHNRPCIHKEPHSAAVHRCCQARNRALADCKNLQLTAFNSSELGAEAYLASLPDLNSTSEIKDYAACINHAVAISVIEAYEGNSMLGTARLVLDSIRTEMRAHESVIRTGIARDRFDRSYPKKEPKSAA